MSDRNQPVGERRLSPEAQALATALIARAKRQRAARDAKRGFAAFVVIVLYGVFMHGIAFDDYEHRTLGLWFTAVFVGAIVYAIVASLVRDEEDDEGRDDERLQRYDGSYEVGDE